MLDWEGKLAATLFVAQCNFKCPFCQNPDLVRDYQRLPEIPWESIASHLISRKGWLDGVVIGGGEPLIHSKLIKYLREIKDFGYPVKIDTNGSRPELLQEIIEKNLVDYIAMDIKTSFPKYSLAAGRRVAVEKIKRSIKILIGSGIEHEFRTTVVPGIVDKEDILSLARYISKGRIYFLQQFNPKITLDPNFQKVKPYDNQFISELVKEANCYIKTKSRGLR